MKTSSMKRALVLAHAFNLLVAIYFIIIAIVSLAKLRWYHQLTITIRVRHFVTSATSYFAFLLLIFAALVLVAIFLLNAVKFTSKTYISPSSQDAIDLRPTTSNEPSASGLAQQQQQETSSKQRLSPVLGGRLSPISNNRLVIRDSTGSNLKNSSLFCSILLHLIASVSLVIILVVWLLNTGELVRDSISTQLDYAFVKYQFSNRTNHYTIAIDGMQDVNNCCGSLDYTDFPHQRISQLSSGHYPGSCCGKNIFGVNARVHCTPEEIVRARQTSGCVTELANYYDLISLLVVPVSLVCLFVNITIIAMLTVSRGYTFRHQHHHDPIRTVDRSPEAQRFELKSASSSS